MSEASYHYCFSITVLVAHGFEQSVIAVAAVDMLGTENINISGSVTPSQVTPGNMVSDMLMFALFWMIYLLYPAKKDGDKYPWCALR